MDLISHIPGVGPTASFNPGATTTAPYNAPQTGAVDGTGPGTATKNMAEIYNRDLLWRRALIAKAGLVFDPTNWVQEVDALTALLPVKASQVEVNAGVDDAKFVTPNKLRLGFAISLTGNGYIAFPTWMGGLIIQWGGASVTGGTTNTVMLPIAFPTGAFMALATPGASATTAFQYATAYCPSASQIALNTNSSVVGVNFLTIGR